MITECILLCGGKGSRLGIEIPKCLVEVAGKTLLEWRIDYFRKNGVRHSILAIGHYGDQVIKFENDKFRELNVSFSIEDANNLLGTGGAINHAFTFIKDSKAYVSNCDDITFPDLENLPDENLMLLTNMRSPFGVIDFKKNTIKQEKGKVSSYEIEKFIEKPLLEDTYVSCGFYILDKKCEFPVKGSIEQDCFMNEEWRKKNSLRCVIHRGIWATVNTQKDIAESEKLLKEISN